jgi:hypothetical protein
VANELRSHHRSVVFVAGLSAGARFTFDDEKPPSLSTPFAVTSFWTRIAENDLTVREVGSGTLPLNGAPTARRVLEVEYKVPDDASKPEPVTYSICSDRHLALKKVMRYSTGRHVTDSSAQWTILFDTASFNRPAPQWLLDMKALPDLIIRKEWIGRTAPDFELPTLALRQCRSFVDARQNRPARFLVHHLWAMP